jgi:hypothetical protein
METSSKPSEVAKVNKRILLNQGRIHLVGIRMESISISTNIKKRGKPNLISKASMV